MKWQSLLKRRLPLRLTILPGFLKWLSRLLRQSFSQSKITKTLLGLPRWLSLLFLLPRFIRLRKT